MTEIDVVGVRPDLLARVSDEVRDAFGDDGPRVAEVFERIMRDNLASVTERLDDGTAFILTGDIPAMWLRDSAAQVRPYLVLAGEDPALADLLVGVLRRQLEFLVLDPYANAFKRGPEPSAHADDRTVLRPEIWERKYEVDSLCFPLDLAHRLWQVTGRADVLDSRFAAAAEAVVDLWTLEQDHSRSAYRFERFDCPPTDTLTRDGLGEPVGWTGMTWSGFRPSDDACRYNYNVPGNMFAHAVLGQLAELADAGLLDPGLGERAGALREQIGGGIEQFGRVAHPEAGEVYAYEVDGLGNALLMDDANMPSLLSAPLSGYLAVDDPRYLATRRLLLSEHNPYYYSGSAAAGIGSPHTPEGYVWPIALAVQGLTDPDPEGKRRLVRLLCDTTAGTGMMHEGFHCDDPARFTREWFSWANAMFCELVLDVAGRRLPG
ncbi:metal-independent alpha-mannosidase [Auraticoccus sp. F435]|uniref:Metal-independent alpha-mannosidase n=1 Tax=Auraticoccus cholistanensis TaxID=2656650 RepID=A0A6A9V0Q2_9ACTN|nr:glycoside hydrolase family 125 protein [Auraticoccus cholistanensis]MVA75780.1 metal-independent alpha-mannosidase [Auraticoccus cholistanensis]